MAHLDTPLSDLNAYVQFFARQPIPVLRHTQMRLDEMREMEDQLNGRAVAGLVLSDPLMTLKVLLHIEAHRGARQNHDITTVERAIMMMGISPFLRTFAGMPTIEEQLGLHPKGLILALKVIGRARRASRYARDWALLRHDMDVDEITVAALLSEVAEILCWCFAPTLTQEVYDCQRTDPSLRTQATQRAVFNASAADIQLALCRHWHLPELLLTMLDEKYIQNPRVRTVQLANNLARHTAHGWDNPAIPDDLSTIETLLHISRENLLNRLAVPHEDAARLLLIAHEQNGLISPDQV